MRYCFPRFLVSAVKDGKVCRSEIRETRRQCAPVVRKMKSEGFETEVGDMTFMDDMTGYGDFLAAARDYVRSPRAVFCVTTRKAYHNPYIAGLLTGEDEESVTRACRSGNPSPKGLLWRSLSVST